MKLSIVATLYQSDPYIREFYERSTVAAQKLVGEDYEIILVNDGSPDRSLEMAIELVEQDKHVKVIDLSRNFGHHKAMMTGLEYARGDRIFLIDSDLEEDPEWLISFSEQMEKEQCDVIYGVQKQRKGNLYERWTGEWFYSLFNRLTGMELPRNVVTARLMTRHYVEALLLHKEREVFLAGIWHITGFDQHPQTVNKKDSSETTYTLRKKFSILINSVTSFSNRPLIWIFYLGISICLISMGYIIYLIIHWIFLTPLSGWTSIVASIWLLGGMIISFIGVIGIYLSKIFIETKERPYTIIKKIYGKQ